MPDGYHCAGEGDCSQPWLDELLCEYVDGTMDADVRAVFEELLRRDDGLARQVEHLRSTRHLLCRHACHAPAAQRVKARIRHRVACEMMGGQRPVLADVAERLGTAAMVASAMSLMLLAGMLAGMTLLAEVPAAGPQRTADAWQEAPMDLGPAPMTPLPRHERPVRRPWFAGRPALTPARSAFLLSGMDMTPAPPSLQRMSAAP